MKEQKKSIPLTIPIDDARKKVKLIRLALEELGTVNFGAIEEYERVSERYEFLLEQKTDLNEAKDTLFQIIDEMDVEMKRRFQETFNSIRFHFESVFQELFGGGRADLRLTNPEDILKRVLILLRSHLEKNCKISAYYPGENEH